MSEVLPHSSAPPVPPADTEVSLDGCTGVQTWPPTTEVENSRLWSLQRSKRTETRKGWKGVRVERTLPSCLSPRNRGPERPRVLTMATKRVGSKRGSRWAFPEHCCEQSQTQPRAREGGNWARRMERETPAAETEKPVAVPSLESLTELCGRVGDRETSRRWKPGLWLQNHRPRSGALGADHNPLCSPVFCLPLSVVTPGPPGA